MARLGAARCGEPTNWYWDGCVPGVGTVANLRCSYVALYIVQVIIGSYFSSCITLVLALFRSCAILVSPWSLLYFAIILSCFFFCPRFLRILPVGMFLKQLFDNQKIHENLTILIPSRLLVYVNESEHYTLSSPGS